jgi:hypothetical protein
MQCIGKSQKLYYNFAIPAHRQSRNYITIPQTTRSLFSGLELRERRQFTFVTQLAVLYAAYLPLRFLDIAIFKEKDPIGPVIFIESFRCFSLGLCKARKQMSLNHSCPRNIPLNNDKPFLIQQRSRFVPWGDVEKDIIPLKYDDAMLWKNCNVSFHGV